MPIESIGCEFADAPCLAPRVTATEFSRLSPPWPVKDFLGLANSFSWGHGATPGVGYALIRRERVESIVSGTAGTLTFEAQQGAVTLTLRGMVFQSARKVGRRKAQDAESEVLVMFRDVRWLANKVVVNRSFNVRDPAAPHDFLEDTLNAGVEWTWKEIVEELWGESAAYLGTWVEADHWPDDGLGGDPFDPLSTPENIILPNIPALVALTSVLHLLFCDLAFDPYGALTGDRFRIIRYCSPGNEPEYADEGAADLPSPDEATSPEGWIFPHDPLIREAGDRVVEDGEFIVGDWGCPEEIVVAFPKRSAAVVADASQQSDSEWGVVVAVADVHDEMGYVDAGDPGDYQPTIAGSPGGQLLVRSHFDVIEVPAGGTAVGDQVARLESRAIELAADAWKTIVDNTPLRVVYSGLRSRVDDEGETVGVRTSSHAHRVTVRDVGNGWETVVERGFPGEVLGRLERPMVEGGGGGPGSGSGSGSASSAGGDNTPWPFGPDGPLCNDGFTAYLLTPVAGNCACPDSALTPAGSGSGSAGGPTCPFECKPDASVGDACNPPNPPEPVFPPVEGQYECISCEDLLPPAALIDGDWSGLSACLAEALEGLTLPNCGDTTPSRPCLYSRDNETVGCGEVIVACEDTHRAYAGFGPRSGHPGVWIGVSIYVGFDVVFYWKQLELDGDEVCNQAHTLTIQEGYGATAFGTFPSEILWIPTEP